MLIRQNSKDLTTMTLETLTNFYLLHRALYTFATANEKRVHAVYCVTGQMITTKQFTIQLVKSTNLEGRIACCHLCNLRSTY